jgi:diguanylate cyclase (GGDEF)-like protein
MASANRLPTADLPDSAHARQLQAGFPWLTFDAPLEAEFRSKQFDEELSHTRLNLCVAILIAIAFSAMGSIVLGPSLNRIPSMLHILVIVPTLMVWLAASFSERRQQIYQPVSVAAATVLGLSVVAVEITAAIGGVSTMFPGIIVAIIFTYLMGGLIFYQAVAANVIVLFVYLAIGTALQLPGRDFALDALAIIATNLCVASVAYRHEKTGRMRFLEAGLLRELVARDGLTGIQNRRMFDQHMRRVWMQAVREQQRVAVLLVDIDCFKDYNDHYGHQAGDECLRAVATSLSQCVRRPLDFVARYGGEEFAVILYEAKRDYVAEVLTRMQRSIAELNIAHQASIVAARLTVSIGAALILPSSGRTLEGLIQLADEALYSAKEQGRNRVVVMEDEYDTLKTGSFDMRRGLKGQSGR